VHDTRALTGEGRKAVDRNPRFADNLRQPGQLARPVLENHCQVRGHRILDLSTAAGTRAIRSSPGGSAPQSPHAADSRVAAWSGQAYTIKQACVNDLYWIKDNASRIMIYDCTGE
jgi:predicted nicotinamide N-methyase